MSEFSLGNLQMFWLACDPIERAAFAAWVKVDHPETLPAPFEVADAEELLLSDPDARRGRVDRLVERAAIIFQARMSLEGRDDDDG